LSTEARPIKVLNTAPINTTRADEIAIETAKTGKVTAVVAVMSIVCKKSASCGVLILVTGSLLTKKAESANFMGDDSCEPRNLSQKTMKGRLSKKLAPNLKKLELK
jgi:hypothetical protein